jgi:hypothetical protein
MSGEQKLEDPIIDKVTTEPLVDEDKKKEEEEKVEQENAIKAAPETNALDKENPITKKLSDYAIQVRTEIDADYVKNIKDVYDLVKRIDDKAKKKIEADFENGIITIEAYNEQGENKSIPVPYIPLTRESNQKIRKIERQAKAFKIDLKNKDLNLTDFQQRYPELTKDIVSISELQDDYSVNDIIGSYAIEQKAKIYFRLTDEQIKMCSERSLGILFYLYEFRNNSIPYWKNLGQ